MLTFQLRLKSSSERSVESPFAIRQTVINS